MLLSTKQVFASAPQKQVSWEACRSYVFNFFLGRTARNVEFCAWYDPFKLFLVIAYHPTFHSIQQSIKEACDRKSLTFEKLLQDLYCHWGEISHTTVLNDKNEEFVCKNLNSLVKKLKSVFDLSSQLITIYDLHDFQMLNLTNPEDPSPLFLQLCCYETADVLNEHREAILKNPDLYKKQIDNVGSCGTWYLVNSDDPERDKAVVVTAKERASKKQEFCTAIESFVEQEQKRAQAFAALKKKFVVSLTCAGSLGVLGLLAWRYWPRSAQIASGRSLLQGSTDTQIYRSPKELAAAGHRELLGKVE
ncbi:MAG: hypothetical protein UV79_C0012G0002 [candidate division TM6 bacterium GW2011_GWF2_43_17]|nr:MAG: hypothetical protein UV79_C0012G0002 [candidate division TM6 bacterium GW2011_GWF2_43_17]